MSDALVDALIGRGAVTRSQAKTARTQQAQRGGRITDHLLEAGCEPGALYEALSVVSSAPLAPREALLRPHVPVGLGVAPRQWVKLCAAPFGTDDEGHVLVALADPADEPHIAELDLPDYIVHLAPSRDIRVALGRGFPELLPTPAPQPKPVTQASPVPEQTAPPPDDEGDPFDEATQAVDAAVLSQVSFTAPLSPGPPRHAPIPEEAGDDFDEATQAVAAAELLQQPWSPSTSARDTRESSAQPFSLSVDTEDKTTVAAPLPAPPLVSVDTEDKTTVAAPIPQSEPLSLSGQLTAAAPIPLRSSVPTTERNTGTSKAPSSGLFTSPAEAVLGSLDGASNPAAGSSDEEGRTEFNLGVLESPRTRAQGPAASRTPALAREPAPEELSPSVLIDDGADDFDEKTLAAEGIGLSSALSPALPLQQLPTRAIPGPMTQVKAPQVGDRGGKAEHDAQEEEDDSFDELSVGALLREAQARMAGAVSQGRSAEDTEAATLTPAVPTVAVSKVVNTQSVVQGAVAPAPSRDLDLDVIATAPAQMVRRSVVEAFSSAVAERPAPPASEAMTDAPVPAPSTTRSTSGASAAAVVIRGYEIQDILGAGGMATVYRAVQRSAGREVALKVLSPQLSSDVAFVARFQREIRASASLTHRNIIRVFDYGDEDGVHYMATEIMDGGSLREAMQAVGALPAALAVKFMEHLLRGIGSAHGNGMVHRDIKPGNLMLSSDGSLKLGDFGIAKSETDESLTKTGALFGTPAYMSPEQTVGRTLDARSDLFSCGIILYEMLSGENPYQAENASASLLKVSRALTPPLLLKAPATPPIVLDVLERLQKRDAAERFGSAAEALAQLAPLVEAVDHTWPTLIEDFVADAAGTAARLRTEQSALECKRARYYLSAEPPLPLAAGTATHLAVTLDRKNAEARALLERLKGSEGFDFGLSQEQRVYDAERALEDDPRAPGLLRRLADLYRAGGNPLRAGIWLREYLLVRPTDSHAHHQVKLLLGPSPLGAFATHEDAPQWPASPPAERETSAPPPAAEVTAAGNGPAPAEKLDLRPVFAAPAVAEAPSAPRQPAADDDATGQFLAPAPAASPPPLARQGALQIVRPAAARGGDAPAAPPPQVSPLAAPPMSPPAAMAPAVPSTPKKAPAPTGRPRYGWLAGIVMSVVAALSVTWWVVGEPASPTDARIAAADPGDGVPAPERQARLLDFAREQLAAGESIVALRAAKRASELAPDSPRAVEVLLVLAQAQAATGDPEGARGVFQEVMKRVSEGNVYYNEAKRRLDLLP